MISYEKLSIRTHQSIQEGDYTLALLQ